MARKPKQGIQYFSHDVDMLQDKKVKLIKAKHKMLGYAVFLRLLEELYMDKGYYLIVDDDFNILFADDNSLDYDVYISILNDCIKYDLFDKNLYEKYGILTSLRVQKNYLEATIRRKEVDIIKEYALFKINDDISNENVNISKLNVDIGTQSKVKGKERESKEEESIYTAIVKKWNSDCLLSNVKTISDARKKSINARISEYGNSFIDDIIPIINDSLYLKGEVNNWKANFDWCINPNNYIKIIEGNYAQSESKPKAQKNRFLELIESGALDE